jgi:hypothetical protein
MERQPPRGEIRKPKFEHRNKSEFRKAENKKLVTGARDVTDDSWFVFLFFISRFGFASNFGF